MLLEIWAMPKNIRKIPPTNMDKMRHSTCIHYLSIHGCALEIDIQKHVGGPAYGWMTRMPCMPHGSYSDAAAMVPCEEYKAPTEEEIQKEQLEFENFVKEAFDDKISPCCKKPLLISKSSRTEIGRCPECRRIVYRDCKR